MLILGLRYCVGRPELILEEFPDVLLDLSFFGLILLYMASLMFDTRAPMLLLFRCLLSYR